MQRWDLDLTPVVRVNMAGSPNDAFGINFNGDTEQYLTRDGFVRWVWDVTPLKGGDYSLFLNISLVDVDSSGKDRTRIIPLDPKIVHVEVTPSYMAREFVHEHLGVLLSSVVIPSFIAVVAWMRGRSKRREKSIGFKG